MFNAVIAETKKAEGSLDPVSVAFGSAFSLGYTSAGGAASAPAAAAAKEPQAVTWFKECSGLWLAGDMEGLVARFADYGVVLSTPGNRKGGADKGMFQGKPGWMKFLLALGREYHYDDLAFEDVKGDDRTVYFTFRANSRVLRTGGQVLKNEYVAQMITFNDAGEIAKFVAAEMYPEKSAFAAQNQVCCAQSQIKLRKGMVKQAEAYMDSVSHKFYDWEGMVGLITFVSDDGTMMTTNAFYKNMELAKAGTPKAMEIFAGMKDMMAGPPERKMIKKASFYGKMPGALKSLTVKQTQVKFKRNFDAIMDDPEYIGLYTTALKAGKGLGFGQIFSEDETEITVFSVFWDKEDMDASEADIKQVWAKMAKDFAGPPTISTYGNGFYCKACDVAVQITDVEFKSPEMMAGFAAWNKGFDTVMPMMCNVAIETGPTSAIIIQMREAEELADGMEDFFNTPDLTDGFAVMFTKWRSSFYGHTTSRLKATLEKFNKKYASFCNMTCDNDKLPKKVGLFNFEFSNINPAMLFFGQGKFKMAKFDEWAETANDTKWETKSGGWLPMPGKDGTSGDLMWVEVTPKDFWVQNQMAVGARMQKNATDFGQYMESMEMSAHGTADDEVRKICGMWAAQPWCTMADHKTVFCNTWF